MADGRTLINGQGVGRLTKFKGSTVEMGNDRRLLITIADHSWRCFPTHGWIFRLQIKLPKKRAASGSFFQ